MYDALPINEIYKLVSKLFITNFTFVECILFYAELFQKYKYDGLFGTPRLYKNELS